MINPVVQYESKESMLTLSKGTTGEDQHGSSCQLYIVIIFQQCSTTENALIQNFIFQRKEMTIQTHDTLSISFGKSVVTNI